MGQAKQRAKLTWKGLGLTLFGLLFGLGIVGVISVGFAEEMADAGAEMGIIGHILGAPRGAIWFVLVGGFGLWAMGAFKDD